MTILSAQLTTFELAIYIMAGLFLPVFIWMIYTGIKVNTTFRKYNKVMAQSGVNAFQAARILLDRNGLSNVQVQVCHGSLTDHYNPQNNTVYLSQATAYSTSIAAIGVAAHEVGHAIQYAQDYLPVKIRTALVPIVNFASRLSFPFILIAILLESLAYANVMSMQISNFFLFLAILCYIVYCLFSFITLPAELNASKRAKQQLRESGVLAMDEVKTTSKVLTAAAMTYISSFVLSLVQLARLLVVFMSRRNRN